MYEVCWGRFRSGWDEDWVAIEVSRMSREEVALLREEFIRLRFCLIC